MLPARLLKVFLGKIKKKVEQVEISHRGHLVHPCPNLGKSPVKGLAHADILGSLTGEYKGQGRGRLVGGGGKNPLTGHHPQGLLRQGVPGFNRCQDRHLGPGLGRIGRHDTQAIGVAADMGDEK